jgi:hypothetical protein
VRAILKNPQNGIKAEELKWTGVEQAVERIAKENGGKVPKEALLRYLQEDGAVRLGEVRMEGSAKGRRPELERELEQMGYGTEISEDGMEIAFSDLNDPGDFYSPAEMRQMGMSAQAANLAQTIQNSFYGEGGTARFGSYQLPGGENYREVVLAMPPLEQSLPSGYRLQPMEALNERGGGVYTLIDPNNQGQRFQAHSASDAQAEAIRLLTNRGVMQKPATYTSSHFPNPPNYVAHARLNERTAAAGKPGLFLEEIQSDRHQAGREKGYVDAAIRNEQEALLAKQTLSDGDLARIEEIKAMGQGDIPDAPFRKDWPVQMFKRALADAVENGKEWIGWTEGITQVDRYTEALRQRVKSIEWTREDGLTIVDVQPQQGKRIYLPVKDGKIYRTADQQSLVGKDLSEVIGKEAAAKVNDAASGKLASENLTIGGEGMKGFYDQILPKEISKYVKQWGAQVEKAQAATRATIDTPQALQTVRRIRSRGGVAASSRSMEQAAKVNSLLSQLERRMSKDRVGFADAWTEIPASTAKNDLKSVLGFQGIKGIASLEEIKSVPIWRVNITPQMRESIKKAGQALFVGGMAAVVAEQEQQ